MRARTWILLASSMTPTAARAEPIVVGVGAGELVTLPDCKHGGFSLDVGAVAVLGDGPWLVVPGAGVAVSPETRHWGPLATLAVQRVLRDDLTLDVAIAFGLDQPGMQLADAQAYVVVSAGVSFVCGPWVISTSIVATPDAPAGLSFHVARQLAIFD